MTRLSLLFFVLLPFTCLAQYSITGKILSGNDKAGVPNASVFLNNATVGTKTANNGTFTLTNVRQGQYDMVVSCVGYETFHINIIVNNDVKVDDITLQPKIMQLQEVRIKSNGNWKKDYEKFKQFFFGTSSYASQCKILNKNLPDILDLDYDPEARLFTAKSTDYLEIENKALGYKIRYFLNGLQNNAYANTGYYEGSASFEELPGSESQKRKWQKNRLNAYMGSSMHFLRSVIANNFTDEGFKVLRIIKQNKKQSGLSGFGSARALVDKPLGVNDFVKATDITGEFALSFDDYLYILYYKRKPNLSEKDKKKLLEDPDALGTPLSTTVIFNEPNAFFDNNGIIINPFSVTFSGNWAGRLVAELLPVDYVPPTEKPN